MKTPTRRLAHLIAALTTAAATTLVSLGATGGPAAAAAPRPADLCAQVAYAAGFRDDALVTAVAVALAESSCNPGASHVNGGGLAGLPAVASAACPTSIDRGLYQLNNCAHPDVGNYCAYDAQCNSDVAYTLSAAGTDWRSHWSAVIDTGAYRTHLAEATAAVRRLGIDERPLCVPVTGDWDGTGPATMGLACKPATGQELQWELINVNSGGSPQIHGHFGSYGCVPVTGDWDGDGDTTVGVACRRSDGRIAWTLSNGFAGAASYSFSFGSADVCQPVTGDWDGDGRTSVGVACRTSRSIEIRWSLINSLDGGSPSYEPFGFGSTSCRPVTGDWDGDGDTTVGAACPSGNGIQWSLIDSLGGGSPSHVPFGFGNAGTCWPVVGDWDGNDSTTVGVACPGVELAWSLINVHRGGSPAVYRTFGTGRSYVATTGWAGPNWPRWPNPY